MTQVLSRRSAGSSFPTTLQLWTPLNMATSPRIYLDVQDSSVTDVSGACAEISNLGSLGTNGNFLQGTASNRPSILNAELNGRRVLRFDGSNDVLTCSTAATLFRNTGAAWVFSVYKKRTTDGSPTARYLLFSSDAGSLIRFSVLAADNAVGRANKPTMFAKRLDADSAAALESPNVVAGSYVMFMATCDYSTRAGVIRENGTQSAANSALTASAGNTSDTSAASATSIGALSAGGSAADIDLATVVVSNVMPSAGEIEKLEGWAAHRWGLAGNLPSGHPYKTTAPTV